MEKAMMTDQTAGQSRFGAAPPELSDEDKSKDAFFVQLAEIAEAMIARHGKDFAMGTLVLSARFIAENKPLIKPKDGSNGSGAKPS
jgi:hypothetical protein